MERTVRTDRYFYIYDNDQEDMIWYSPSSDDRNKCDRNLLNCIEEARRILRRNSNANIQIYARVIDMCGEYEDGDEYSVFLANPSELDSLERIVKEEGHA